MRTLDILSTMRWNSKTIFGTFVLLTPVLIYLFVFYKSIVLFLIPAFTTYFELYGVLGTFGLWAGLTLAGFFSTYSFIWLLLRR